MVHYEVDSLKKIEMKPLLHTKLIHSHLFHSHFKTFTDTVVNVTTALEKWRLRGGGGRHTLPIFVPEIQGDVVTRFGVDILRGLN